MVHFLALIGIFILTIIFFVLAFFFGIWRMIRRRFRSEKDFRRERKSTTPEKKKVFDDDEGEYVDFEEVEGTDDK